MMKDANTGLSLGAQSENKCDIRVFSRSTELEVSDKEQQLKLCKHRHQAAIVERVCGVNFDGLPFWMWIL
jgi:hypothetical protein